MSDAENALYSKFRDLMSANDDLWQSYGKKYDSFYVIEKNGNTVVFDSYDELSKYIKKKREEKEEEEND